MMSILIFHNCTFYSGHYDTRFDAKLFEPESKMTNLCGEMIIPQFRKYKYIHEIGSRPGLFLYWIRDSVAIFKKEISLFINCNQLIFNERSWIDVIVSGYHRQGVFRILIVCYEV